MTTSLSDHLICTACNSIGCDSVNERTLVHIKQFIIHVTPKKISVGDDVTLECIALKSFASEVNWRKDYHLKQYSESGKDWIFIYKDLKNIF